MFADPDRLNPSERRRAFRKELSSPPETNRKVRFVMPIGTLQTEVSAPLAANLLERFGLSDFQDAGDGGGIVASPEEFEGGHFKYRRKACTSQAAISASRKSSS